jgi:hypothetical protein
MQSHYTSWDANHENNYCVLEPTCSCTCVCVCPHLPSYLLVGCSDGTVRLHSLTSSRPLTTRPSPDVVNPQPVVNITWSYERPCVFYVHELQRWERHSRILCCGSLRVKRNNVMHQAKLHSFQDTLPITIRNLQLVAGCEPSTHCCYFCDQSHLAPQCINQFLLSSARV